MRATDQKRGASLVSYRESGPKMDTFTSGLSWSQSENPEVAQSCHRHILLFASWGLVCSLRVGGGSCTLFLNFRSNKGAKLQPWTNCCPDTQLWSSMTLVCLGLERRPSAWWRGRVIYWSWWWKDKTWVSSLVYRQRWAGQQSMQTVGCPVSTVAVLVSTCVCLGICVWLCTLRNYKSDSSSG